MQPTSVADKASLSDLRRRIRADLAREGADPAVTFDCLVAITEACTSALGDCEDASDAPDISWRFEPSCVCFTVSQTCTRRRSKASHPSRAPRMDLRAAEPLERAQGTHLMKSLMDDVRIHDGPTGRIVTLTKLLQ